MNPGEATRTWKCKMALWDWSLSGDLTVHCHGSDRGKYGLDSASIERCHSLTSCDVDGEDWHLPIWLPAHQYVAYHLASSYRFEGIYDIWQCEFYLRKFSPGFSRFFFLVTDHRSLDVEGYRTVGVVRKAGTHLQEYSSISMLFWKAGTHLQEYSSIWMLFWKAGTHLQEYSSIWMLFWKAGTHLQEYSSIWMLFWKAGTHVCTRSI